MGRGVHDRHLGGDGGGDPVSAIAQETLAAHRWTGEIRRLGKRCTCGRYTFDLRGHVADEIERAVRERIVAEIEETAAYVAYQEGDNQDWLDGMANAATLARPLLPREKVTGGES